MTTLDKLSKAAIDAAKLSPMISSTVATTSAIANAGGAMAIETVAEVAATTEVRMVMLIAAAVELRWMMDETRVELGVGASESAAAASEAARLAIGRQIVTPVAEKERVPVVVVDRSITIR